MAAFEATLLLVVAAIMLLGIKSFFDGKSGIMGGASHAVEELLLAKGNASAASGNKDGTSEPIEIKPTPGGGSGPSSPTMPSGDDAGDGSTSADNSAGIAKSVADWANQAFKTNDERFHDSTTDNVLDWILHPEGYAKCNEFVASAFKEGAGVDYPQINGRDPVVPELANKQLFKDQLTYTTDPAKVKVGDIVVWYDEAKDVHHSAILSGYDADGSPIVTYAGAGEEIRQISLTEATLRLKGVSPIFRSWKGSPSGPS